MRFLSRAAFGLLMLHAIPAMAAGQEPLSGDSLHLGALQAEAVARDPRGRQLGLIAAQSTLRLRSIGSEWLPRLSGSAVAQYQSEVAGLPAQEGAPLPLTLPHDSYDASVAVRQPIFDPGISARRAVEQAAAAESGSAVRVALHALRQSVADAYFTVLLLDAQRAELDAAVTGLEARHAVARERVNAGEALESEARLLEAELLRRRESLSGLAVNRAAAAAVLGTLTGLSVADAALSLPDLTPQADSARAALGAERLRPEYEQFARAREALESRSVELGRRNWPRLSAIGRGGVGRPGLNPFDQSVGGYWLAGIQLEWSPWDWGRAGLEREALGIQQEIVATEEAAFSERIARIAIRDLATIDRLKQSLDADREIIALYGDVLRETQVRFDEGVVTSAEYVDRETDLLAARLARATHTIELAEARARFLTLVGWEVP
ncbi:MAG TPA: TolC family protein [Gemmatimonadales bacterium]|nr:TolC family protein [Gemmatimonadales bacterium]